MKAEVIYTNLMEYVRTLPENDQTFIERTVASETKCKAGLPVTMLLNILIDLKAEMRRDYAKLNGKADVLKAAKNILKAAQKNGRIAGAVTVDGVQVIRDNYRLLVLDNPLDLPSCDNTDTAKSLLTNVLHPTASYSQCINTPTAAAVKLHIANAVADGQDKHKVEYDFGPDLPVVNAEYLLDFIQAMPDAKISWSGNLVSAIRFSGNGVTGLLMPIRKKRAA